MNNNNRCMIIAEAGVNHNGKLDVALELCLRAKEAGADVVKFQTWKTDKIITKKVKQADYQALNTGIQESQFDMLKKLELSYDDFEKIKKYCDDIGIIFASTADDEESLDFLINLGIPFIKIGSGDIGNIKFLRYIGTKKMPVIISTGMSSLAEIDISLNTLKDSGTNDITILHCTTNYPCPYEEVNLNAMVTLKNAFHLPVGYSDHTLGKDVAIAAKALGATVIEKHFTLDRHMDGPDHLASTEPNEFRNLVQAVRRAEIFMGSGIKFPTNSERKISKVVTKRIVAAKDIKKGELFTSENLTVKRNDIGEKAVYWDFVIGKVSSKNYIIDEGIIV